MAVQNDDYPEQMGVRKELGTRQAAELQLLLPGGLVRVVVNLFGSRTFRENACFQAGWGEFTAVRRHDGRLGAMFMRLVIHATRLWVWIFAQSRDGDARSRLY